MTTPDGGIRTAQLSSLFLPVVTPSQVKSHHHLSPGIPARRGGGALLTKLPPARQSHACRPQGRAFGGTYFLFFLWTAWGVGIVSGEVRRGCQPGKPVCQMQICL